MPIHRFQTTFILFTDKRGRLAAVLAEIFGVPVPQQLLADEQPSRWLE